MELMGKTFQELGNPLRSISVDLTEGCSLRCKYCFQDLKSEKKENRKLTEQTMVDTINWIFDDKTSGEVTDVNKSGGLRIELWGGEPLHNWDILVKLVKYQKEKSFFTGKKVKFGGTTNQVEFTRDRLQFLYDNNVSLLVSFDGVNHDKYRVFPDGSGSSDIILKNLDLFFEIYKRTPELRISLHPDYIDTLYESYELVLSKGIRNYFFSPVFEQTWTEQHYHNLKTQLLKIYKKEQLLLSQGFPPLHNKFIDEMINLIINSKKHGIDLENIEELDRKELMKIQSNQSNKPCGQGTSYLEISIDGQIYICHRFNKHNLDESIYPFKSRYGWMGSIYTGIEKPDLYEELNNWNVDEVEHCKTCKFKYFCNGGCYQSNYDHTGKINGELIAQCRIKETLYDTQLEILDIYSEFGLYDKNTNEIKFNLPKHTPNNSNITGNFKTCRCYNGAYLVKDVEEVLSNLSLPSEVSKDMELKLARQGLSAALKILENK